MGTAAMKTPWRFVSDLVSRKPADKPQDAPPSSVVEAKAPENLPIHEERAEQTPSPEPIAVDVAAENAAHDEIEAAPAIPEEPISEAPEPATAEATAPVSEIDATDAVQEPVAATTVPGTDASTPDVETAPAIASEKAPEPKAQRASKREKRPTPLAPQISVDALVAPPKTFLEEMTDLDHEIATLRRQLSAKLAEQNAQMRELLDRYNAR